MNEENSFLKDLGIEEKKSVLDEPLNPEPEKVEEAKEEENDDEVAEYGKSLNRKIRRKLEEGQRYRDEAIMLGERLKTLTEVGKFREEVGDDSLKEVEAIFGTDSPEKLAATNILKKALSGMSEKAKQEALQEIESRQSSESEAVRTEERNLDDIADHVEDNYGIDMESEGPAYYTLLEKLSPKDRDGNIIEYADPDTTAEVYLSQRDKSSTRAKELASRGMVRSGESQPSKLEDDAMVRILKENGIL